MTDRDKLKAAIQQSVEAEKDSLARWLGSAPRQEKILAMMEAVFGHYIAVHGEADALEMIAMNFEGYVSKRRGPLH